MQLRGRFVFASALAVLVVAGASCRNMSMVPKHEEDLPRNWKGHHVDQLIHNWGQPTTVTDLPYESKSYLFEHADYLEGEEIYCWAIFVANSRGVIRSLSIGGNRAGCNWVLATGKRSPRNTRGGSRPVLR